MKICSGEALHSLRVASRGQNTSRSPAETVTAPAARFASTRRAHRAETVEDYVEAIGQLSAHNRSGARVRDLALMMGVSHVTVVRTVSRLQGMGLVETSRGKPVVLTPAGRLLARRARRKHEAVLGFLLALGVPPVQAAIDAEGIEHHASEATVRAMRRALRAGLGGGRPDEGSPSPVKGRGSGDRAGRSGASGTKVRR
jgi:DtxR family transcriptional regulator, manganese transport regulator